VIELLGAAITFAQGRPEVVTAALLRHLALCGAALGLAVGLGLPLGLLAARGVALAEGLVAAVSALRVVPSLAILFIAVPVLGIGFAPALLALSLLAAPPVLLATVAGFRGVDADLKRVARGMGMSPLQQLRRVETPLAAPVVASGLRTASVEVIASATLAAFIGAGGLGDFITLGFQLNRPAIMLVGAVPVALLALGSEVAFGLLDRWLGRWQA
jgi:osmoprotectant transport system permease protein